jgi:hypothetical protein
MLTTAVEKPVADRRRLILLALCLGVLVAQVDTSVVNPSSRSGGFFECALVVDQRVNRKGLHYRGISDIAPMAILAGSRGAVRVPTLAARS